MAAGGVRQGRATEVGAWEKQQQEEGVEARIDGAERRFNYGSTIV